MGRPFAAIGPVLAATLIAGRANAASPDPDLPRLVLDTGRPTVPPGDLDTYRFVLHGEEQIRYQLQRDLPFAGAIASSAGGRAVVDTPLGQSQFLHHWLRLSPRLQLRDDVDLVAQLDLVTGILAGDRARTTDADVTPRTERNGFENVQPRWLYADWRVPFGRVRIGQQPHHWGMGLLANDGDHPLLFGDYRYGAISERLSFSTKPGGKDSPFTFFVAGDLVFRDNYARLVRGEQAYQGIVAATYERGENRLGIYSAVRHQERERSLVPPSSTYIDELDSATLDVHGRLAMPLPSDPNAFLFLEAEAAYVLGTTRFNPITTEDKGPQAQVKAFGGAARVGVVHRTGDGAKAYGDLVGQVELGYASGDGNPNDRTYRRFVFDPNHRIGLLLFDEVLRFQTARAATLAADPTLAPRPGTGIDDLPSNGGLFGAQYINPTAVYRPRHWLDLKGGLVVAQATTNVVDPLRSAIAGLPTNARGGDPNKRDLGIELDAGVETRIAVADAMTLQLGAQGGVLFPGGALEDATGARLRTPWIAVGRVGLVF